MCRPTQKTSTLSQTSVISSPSSSSIMKLLSWDWSSISIILIELCIKFNENLPFLKTTKYRGYNNKQFKDTSLIIRIDFLLIFGCWPRDILLLHFLYSCDDISRFIKTSIGIFSADKTFRRGAIVIQRALLAEIVTTTTSHATTESTLWRPVS